MARVSSTKREACQLELNGTQVSDSGCAKADRKMAVVLCGFEAHGQEQWGLPVREGVQIHLGGCASALGR